MKIKITALIVAIIMIVSLCSCSVTINKQESTQTTESVSTSAPDSKPAAQPVSTQQELEYRNDAVGYGIYKLPEAFKSPNFMFLTEDVSGDIVIITMLYAFVNDGYAISDVYEDQNALRGAAYIGTMFFSTAGDISKETLDDIGVDINTVQELQRNDGNNLFYVLYTDEDCFEKKEALTENEIAIVNEAMTNCVETMKNVVAVERTYPKLSFTTVDFYGNPITSEECFSSNDVTLLNIWASFCTPCENEMPSLVEANDIVSKEGCQVLLCLYDTDDRNSEKYQDAIGLLERAGASNLKCIMVNDEIKQQLNEYVSGYPTSFPIGSDGQILGDKYDGDRSVDSFVDWIKSYKK